MRRMTFLNKLISLSLVAILFMSSYMGVYASADNNFSTSVDEQETVEIVTTSEDSNISNDISESEIQAEYTSVGDNGEESADNTNKDLNEEQNRGGEESEKKDSVPEDSEEKNPEDVDEKDKKASDGETEDKKESKEDKQSISDDDTTNDCEHEYEYESKGDGTHIKKCKTCNFEESEPCVDEDADGFCDFCKAEMKKTTPDSEEKKDEQEDKEYTVTVNGHEIKAFVLAGTFEGDVEFIAKSIDLTDEQKEMLSKKVVGTDNTDKSISVGDFLAFDFEFNSEGNKVQPKEGHKVKITINNVNTDVKALFHLNGENTEDVSFTSESNNLTFEAGSFSPYVAVSVDSVNVLYEKSAYGAAYTMQNHRANTKTIGEAYGKNRYALSMFSLNTPGNDPVIIKPDDGKYYIYGSSKAETFNFSIEAPENFYIEKVFHYTAKDGDIKNPITKKEFTPDGSNVTKYDVAIDLVRMGDDKSVNYVGVSLKPIPVKLTSDKQSTVKANFIKYQKDTHAFGDDFWFNGGDTGNDNNRCHYDQVHQGLASATFDGKNFKLAPGMDNGNPPLPTFEEYEADKNKYSYITKYYPNANIEFSKDENGYWTIDSAAYMYVYDEKDNTLHGKKGNQFRPFGSGVNHFGMLLPIQFSVNSDGMTDGKDTIFRFSGDDDVFVYVDDKLVLDLGGIHDIIYGQINFKTGEVLIQGNKFNRLTSSIEDNCYSRKGIGNTNLYTLLGTDLSSFSKTEHTLTVAYFERGGYLSNCRISYNFNKDEAVDVEYEGFKLNADKKPLEGAQFTLYTDENCTNIAKIGVNDAVATSDDKGTIKFEGLSIGVKTSSAQEITKTYYMKETKAPEGYKTPLNAKWKLTLTAKADGTTTDELKAVTEEAKAISLDKEKNPITEDKTVSAITNDKAYGYLVIEKKLKTFNKSLKTASFVFLVEAKNSKDQMVYSNVFALDFDKAETKQTEPIKLPADSKVTVTEVYSGASYKAEINEDGNALVEIVDKIIENETKTVHFVNNYSDDLKVGSISIVNVFEKKKKKDNNTQNREYMAEEKYIFKGNNLKESDDEGGN